MAGVPEGPDAFFRIGPAQLAKPECFAVKQGKTRTRAEVVFHRPSTRERLALLEECDYEVKELGAVLSDIRYGVGSPPPYLDINDNTVPFVRATDIKNGDISTEGLLHVASEQPKHMEKNRLVGGELIIVRSGVNTGDCAVVPQALANSFAAYDLILNFRPNASAKFIGMFLDTTIGRTQLGLVKGRSAQPHINAEEVEALRVPLPQIGDQERFVVLMEKSRESRKAKLADADALLGGIDEFVLEALGINPARKEDRQVFAVKLGESRTQGQLNPEYYHPERILALRALSFAVAGYHVSSLSRVASFQRNQLESPGQGYLSLAHVQSNTGELTDSTDTASGACFMYQANDVLFARLRPYLNKVHVAVGEGCCSTEFHVLRVKDPSTLLPEYLGAILRSRLTLSQTVHMMTGNTHPRLTNRDMENLQIPIPHVDKQRVIADEVVRRRSEARKLRSEAEADWEVAKQWFEEQLLGK